MGTVESIEPAESGHRRRLLEGLAESIRERGLADTQVSDIVRHARASRRTFYNEFPDKDSCVVALAEERSIDQLAQIAATVDERLDWQEQVDRAVDKYLQILVDDRAMTITFAVELATLGKAGQAVRRRAVERFAEFVTTLTSSEPMRRAGVRAVNRYTAIVLIGGINELVSWAVANGEPLEALAPSVKDALKSVLAPPEA
jgi:AcrR family transcriptional regulator